MARYGDDVLSCFANADAGYVVTNPPKWLAIARWKPRICLGRPGDRRVLAVDVVPSGAIPTALYQGEVVVLQRKHKNLRVVVCVLEEGIERHPEIEEFCRKLGIGLKVFLPGFGMETKVRTDLDPYTSESPIPIEEGWFPARIVERARGLKRLAFASTIDQFVAGCPAVASDDTATLRLVCSTIDALLQQHRTFSTNIGQYMRLAHFESLLKLTSPEATEHVFYSFRVFLAGCPIIDQFYQVFRMAHERFQIGRAAPSVEYAWLLSAVFHDVGRPKEGATRLMDEELGDPDIEVVIRGKDTRWLRDEYRRARDALGSLAAFVAAGAHENGWDAGAIADQDAREMTIAWTRLYDSLESHAIIGSLDFLAHVFQSAAAVNERTNRPFVLSHAVPAALAILLHDWRIWKNARSWKIFPINVAATPLAALLIYLDTWDDYKRKGPNSLIYVRDYVVDDSGARVTVEWADSAALEKEKIKYEAFKTALLPGPFSLTIDAHMAEAE